jgi:hypothetical protein
MTKIMNYDPLVVDYITPSDGPSIEEVTKVARKLNLTLDEFVSRSIVLYHEEVTDSLADPVFMAQFDLDSIVATAELRDTRHEGQTTD